MAMAPASKVEVPFGFSHGSQFRRGHPATPRRRANQDHALVSKATKGETVAVPFFGVTVEAHAGWPSSL